MVPWEEDPKERRLCSFKVIVSVDPILTFLPTSRLFDPMIHSSLESLSSLECFEAKISKDTNKQNLLIPENIDGMGTRSPPYNKVYDNVFRCIYDLEPKLSAPVDSDMKDFMTDVISLLQAAEHLGAGSSVRRTIEANCLRLNQLVFKHIARNSAAWCDIALRIQSSTLFRAAMAHLVGRFDLRGRDGIDKQALKDQPNGDLLMEFASKKAAELKDKKLRIERLLMEYYPPKMHRPQIAGQKVPGRDDYIEDIYLWQALTIVRQYISSAFMSHMNHRAQDGGTWLYQCIAAGGDTYLRRDGLERFHVEFAMSAKGKDCLRLAVATIKGSLCEIVQPLLVDRSNIYRTEEDPRPRYLTCCEIEDDELPWLMGGVEE